MSQSAYTAVQETLKKSPRKWIVTGAAGFIGSHLVETLLKLNQLVIGADNFSTGKRENLVQIEKIVGKTLFRKNFSFYEGDISDRDFAVKVCKVGEIILHQAALGSVPRSIEDPLKTNQANVTGFISMIIAAKECGIKRFVYASSSSVYGDSAELPKKEDLLGKPLSPYAVSKLTNELYASACAPLYGLEMIGLRYFNVFGPRQDPHGAYAAVIPRWVETLRQGKSCLINGDGETSRDFCYVANTVQVNILAGVVKNPSALNKVYNVACGARTTLNELHAMIAECVKKEFKMKNLPAPEYVPFRAGDVRHSLADISLISNLLGYQSTHTIEQGLSETIENWSEV